MLRPRNVQPFIATMAQARLHSTRRQRMGFIRNEFGMEWHPTKEALLESATGPVLVGTSYEYTGKRAQSESVQQARKYSSFPSHHDYWERICLQEQNGHLHNFHEIFSADHARCLYFDIDGDVGYKDTHADIISWLKAYVRWFFGGDRQNWKPDFPEAVVLKSSDPRKYSCHVIFPQIQFANHLQQQEYMAVLLNGLPALQADLDSGESIPILDRIVDRVPYNQFQLLRGPKACKLKDGHLHAETCLEPEGTFRSDPLAYFAGHVDPDYKIELPTVHDLLSWNEELRDLQERQADRLHRVHRVEGYGPYSMCVQDATLLYHPDFEVGRASSSSGTLDLGGLTDLEKYEMLLPRLHPYRATQYWSWFRISGVTYTMLQRYKHDMAAQERIWNAHVTWSSTYSQFDGEENIKRVAKAEGADRVSGLPLLFRLVTFDNPCLKLRISPLRMFP